MKIKLNPDQEIVNTIREGLKRTGGYCPCRRERTEATKCKPTPRWMSSRWFRYGFLLFFLTMFGNMVCILPDGNHDAGYLQAEKQRIITDNRKEPFSWLK